MVTRSSFAQTTGGFTTIDGRHVLVTPSGEEVGSAFVGTGGTPVPGGGSGSAPPIPTPTPEIVVTSGKAVRVGTSTFTGGAIVPGSGGLTAAQVHAAVKQQAISQGITGRFTAKISQQQLQVQQAAQTTGGFTTREGREIQVTPEGTEVITIPEPSFPEVPKSAEELRADIRAKVRESPRPSLITELLTPKSFTDKTPSQTTTTISNLLSFPEEKIFQPAFDFVRGIPGTDVIVTKDIFGTPTFTLSSQADLFGKKVTTTPAKLGDVLDVGSFFIPGISSVRIASFVSDVGGKIIGGRPVAPLEVTLATAFTLKPVFDIAKGPGRGIGRGGSAAEAAGIGAIIKAPGSRLIFEKGLIPLKIEQLGGKISSGVKGFLPKAQDLGAAKRLFGQAGRQFISLPISRGKFAINLGILKVGSRARKLSGDFGIFLSGTKGARSIQSIRRTAQSLRLQRLQFLGTPQTFGILGRAERGRASLGLQRLRISARERFQSFRGGFKQDTGAAKRLFGQAGRQFVTSPISRIKLATQIKIPQLKLKAGKFTENLRESLRGTGLIRGIGSTRKTTQSLRLQRLQLFGTSKGGFLGRGERGRVSLGLQRLKLSTGEKIKGLKINFIQDTGAAKRLFGQAGRQFIISPISRIKLATQIKIPQLKLKAGRRFESSSLGRLSQSIQSRRLSLNLGKIQREAGLFTGERFGFLGKGRPSILRKGFEKQIGRFRIVKPGTPLSRTFADTSVKPFIPASDIGIKRFFQKKRISRAREEILMRSDVGFQNVLRRGRQPIVPLKVSIIPEELPKNIQRKFFKVQEQKGRQQLLILKPRLKKPKLKQEKIETIVIGVPKMVGGEGLTDAQLFKFGIGSTQIQRLSLSQIKPLSSRVKQVFVGKQEQALGAFTALKSGQGFQQGSKQAQNVASRFSQDISTVQKGITLQRQPQAQRFLQRFRIEQIARQRAKSLRIEPGKRFRIVPFKFKQPKIEKEPLGKIPVLVRRKGKFGVVGFGKDVGEAISIGKDVVGKTLARSFTIRGVKPGKIPGFRTKKEKIGPVFIEPAKRALSTKTEQKEILGFKRASPKRKTKGRKK